MLANIKNLKQFLKKNVAHLTIGQMTIYRKICYEVGKWQKNIGNERLELGEWKEKIDKKGDKPLI